MKKRVATSSGIDFKSELPAFVASLEFSVLFRLNLFHSAVGFRRGMKKWIVIFIGCGLSSLCQAQLPIPLLPDWLAPTAKEGSEILHRTQVTLASDNFTVLQTNVMGRSRGFKILGLISVRSPSYTEAMSRMYSQARLQTGRPQAFANVLYEQTSSSFILFSIPKIKIRADLIEFNASDEGEEATSSATPVLLGNRNTRQRP